jgi:hypothetical protein
MSDLTNNRNDLKVILKGVYKDTKVLDLIFKSKLTFEKFFKDKVKPQSLITPWSKLPKTLDGFYKTYACDLDWAKSLNFCKVNTPTSMDDKVGDYTTDNKLIKNFKIRKLKDTANPDVDALYISSSDIGRIPALVDFTVSKLIPTTDTNVFDISSLKLGQTLEKVITFNDKGFVLEYMTFKINATKVVGSGVDDNATDEDDDDTPNSVTNTTTNPDNKKPNIPIVKSKPLYFNNDQKDTTPKKSCNDFPFTLGCVNTKIGDLNAVLFRGKRYDDMYNKQLENFLDNIGYFSNSNNELTKDTWNDLMNRNTIKESVKKVLKEYINKKK